MIPATFLVLLLLAADVPANTNLVQDPGCEETAIGEAPTNCLKWTRNDSTLTVVSGGRNSDKEKIGEKIGVRAGWRIRLV